MTPRLKILLAMLGISILVMIADKISIASEKSSKQTLATKSKVEKRNNGQNKPNNKVINNINNSNSKDQSSEFTLVSKDVLSLQGWGVNPFVKRVKNIPLKNNITKTTKGNSPNRVSTMDNIKIVGVLKIENEALVRISGKNFRVGEKFNNMIIEKINPREITFRQGNNNYVVNVGS